jgi:putative PIN family toxin of toxin-antitoxin system
MGYKIVIDTNVFVSALRSNQGASFKLLSLIDRSTFEIELSVPLLLEYEAAAQAQSLKLNAFEVQDILDYMCSVANRREIFFLWRPFLKDPKDDLVLELAVESEANYIITFNKKDFKGSEKFGIKVITPRKFLRIIGETK